MILDTAAHKILLHILERSAGCGFCLDALLLPEELWILVLQSVESGVKPILCVMCSPAFVVLAAHYGLHSNPIV
jgi:hypothetical protein